MGKGGFVQQVALALVRMLTGDELWSHGLGRAAGDRDPGEDPVQALSVRIQLCFSHGSHRSAREVVRAPPLPSVHLNFLAAGTRGQYRLGYGQGAPGKENWGMSR